MSKNELHCFHCNEVHVFSDTLSFRACCEKCDEGLHICKNCEFYDENSYNECKESSAERVKDKGKNNLCDLFRPHQASRNKKDSSGDLLKQAEALFKNKNE